MMVDEPRRNDQTAGIYGPCRAAFDAAQFDHLTALDPDVG
jgi:hypothetical protein